jgi:hypothetical protein
MKSSPRRKAMQTSSLAAFWDTYAVTRPKLVRLIGRLGFTRSRLFGGPL